MEKVIWILGHDRESVLDIQRKINSVGSMRALCILSVDALKKTIDERLNENSLSLSLPSVILVDYEMFEKENCIPEMVKSHPKLAGVPLFFAVENADTGKEERCYMNGAMVVLQKPITPSGITRIERAAWQYEVTKKYERILQKQVSELQTAKEIYRLNQQLESRNEFLYRIFGKYFSDDVLDVILDKPEGALIGGEKRKMAILMSDLRGFSSMAEEMSADAMTDLLNFFFGRMVDVISKYDGTVIEFMGDGVLAVFGAPMRNEHYRESAIAAAIEMQNTMQEVNQYCWRMGYETLEMGIGIHSGEAFVGNVGSEKMMRYNVLGGVVNECSRIEGYSIGGQILVSKSMIEKLSCEVQVSGHADIFVKGIRRPVEICEISGIGGGYNRYLKSGRKEPVFVLEQGVILNIYQIHNKIVVESSIPAVLHEISTQIAMVEIVEDGKLNRCEIPTLYSDVEIEIGDGYGTEGFYTVYAKVVRVDGKKIQLHFTHINHEFRNFIVNIQKDTREGIEMDRQAVSKIKLKETSLERLEDAMNSGAECVLYWAQDGDGIRLVFTSNDRSIRALEFVDYMVSDCAMAKGNGRVAQAVISETFLRVNMAEAGLENVAEFLGNRIDLYYNECQWIYADDYVAEHKAKILQLPRYIKKKIPWAYVKTSDIISEGSQFRLKSLENESDITLTSSKDLYIMIGCRGEIYDISSEKFEKTYDTTDERLDVYEQMLDFLPEVRLCSQDEFVSLDEYAHLCFPKNKTGILVRKLEQRTKVFTVHNNGEYFVGRAGDFLVIREDDLSDMYIIQQEIFFQTYEEAEKL